MSLDPSGLGSLLSHAHADVFQKLGLSASIVSYEPAWKFTDSPQWRLMHHEPSVIPFEIEHGVEFARYHYNTGCLARVYGKHVAVLGAYAGLCDLFVPITRQARVLGVLVVGPFASARPTSAEVLQRWRGITGRQGHLADAEFAHYVSTMLATPVLNKAQVRNLTQFLTSMAALMADDGKPEKHLARADALRDGLDQVRREEEVWAAARSIVHERSSRSWSSPHRKGDLAKVGLSSTPDAVVVGLIAGAQRQADPVGELLNRDAFQRRCVHLAFSSGGTISGQIGDYGVTFLSRTGGAGSARHERLLELARKAAVLARQRFGLRLHLGSGSLPKAAPLSEQYEVALAAAESALTQGVSSVHAAKGSPGHGAALGKLRHELGTLAEADPKTLPPLFDRYVEAVALHCGYRIDAARAHLEAGFQDISRGLEEGGALETRSIRETHAELDRSADAARTVVELFDAYRRGVADVSGAAEHPRATDREFRMRRALTHVERHYAEPLTLASVAKVAGFSPRRFARLFQEREHTTFAHHLRQLRIERAKQLLINTDLEIKRIAALCGFTSQQYFARTFRRVLGTTPLSWRKPVARLRSKRTKRKSS